MKLKNKKIIEIGIILIFIAVIFIYGNIISKHILIEKFAKNNIEVYEKNENSVFNVEKIILCSSANAIDESEGKNLQNLNIYQYTDIAIYINNGEELTTENTINKLYIDNISFGLNDLNKSLNYRNPKDFGLNKKMERYEEKKDRIDFNIVYTNSQNEETDYNEPNFYTDCSNPITLQYINSGLMKDYKIEENKSVIFDGTLLKEANINQEKIETSIKFKINIINNKNEYFSCWVNFKVPLKDLYNKGTTMKSKATDEKKYVFYKS